MGVQIISIFNRDDCIRYNLMSPGIVERKDHIAKGLELMLSMYRAIFGIFKEADLKIGSIALPHTIKTWNKLYTVEDILKVEKEYETLLNNFKNRGYDMDYLKKHYKEIDFDTFFKTK